MSGAGDEATRKADAEDCKNRGNEFLAKGDTKSAIEWYTQAIHLDASNPVYFSNRSAAYLTADYKETALKDAKECIRLKPTWSKGYSRLGAAYHAMDKYEEALKSYEDGLAIDPENQALKQAKEEVDRTLHAPPPGAESFMSGLMQNPEVMDYLRRHPEKMQSMNDPMVLLQDTEFMGILQRALGGMGGMGGMGMPPMDPGNDEEAAAAAAELEAARKREKAEAEAEAEKKKTEAASVPMTPEHRQAQEKKAAGNEKYKRREFQEAIALYEEAQSLDPSDIVYSLNIASCLLELGEVDACISRCEKAIEVGRQQNCSFESLGRAYQRIGNAQMKKGAIADAIASYKQSLMEFNDPPTRNRLLEAERLLDKQEKESYVNPELSSEHKERGNALMKQNKAPEAVREYDEAIRRNPKDAVLYCNRGAAYSVLMDYSRALSDIEKSLALDPKYVKAWGRKGAIEFFLKKYHRALEAYQKGLELDPTNQVCLDGLEATQQKIQEGMYKVDPERQARAAEDPEIQRLMSDPMVQQALRDISDPKARDVVMRNPGMMEKIQKLIAAGMISMGSGPSE